ncbi:MAG: uroporphyrinogen-III synthase [Ardenticatenales bacterium]|nr:uroporphyrinogen-III synthase [Ardenticatenales bacterium]
MIQTQPLQGRRIVVTRAQGSDLVQRLVALGAQPIEFPVIEIVPPEDGYAALDTALATVASYDWLVFTSANAVEPFWERLSAAGKGAESLRHLRLAAVGSATAAALEARGLTVDILPDRFVAESLLAALEAEGIVGKRFLFPCAAGARATLPQGLVSAGGQVSAPHAYRTVAATPADTVLAALDEGVDMVTFLSGSAVCNFVEQVGPLRLQRLQEKSRFAAIGPVTAQAAHEAGLTVAIEPAEHTARGLVAAIVDYYSHPIET